MMRLAVLNKLVGKRAAARGDADGAPTPDAEASSDTGSSANPLAARVVEAAHSIKQRVANTPAVQKASEAVRARMAVVEEFSQSVKASQTLQAAWSGLRSHLYLIIAFSGCINLIYLAPSLYMMQVYDRVLPTGGYLTLILLSVVLVVSLAVMGTLDAMRSRLLARAGLRVERLASAALIRETLTLRRAGAPPAATAGMRDLDTLKTGLASPAMIGVIDLPWTPLFIIISFVIHPVLGFLALGGAALIFGLALINERASRAGLQAVSQRAPGFYAAHESDLNSAETIYALGAEPALTRRRLAAREELNEAQTQSAFDNAGYSATTKAVRMGLQSAALGVGCYLAIQQEISPGAIIAASILTARAFAPVEQIVGGWRQLGLAFAAYKALHKVFTSAAGEQERTPLPAPEGRLQADNLAAAAPGGRALGVQGVSFSVQPGEIIGIIGPSGAGKTTLARVLANATPPHAGTIRIDGARYADWDHRALARHIGYMPQRIDLFDGTVAENISCFARSEGESMESVGEKVVAAAKAAGAHELILALPNGYETMLGFSGSGVSPGQAQRIALARALYNDPTIIVLDEPNAHLDNDGENALIKALEGVRARKGVAFIVAHRAGVIGMVDKILVLRDARLIEFGPRAEVMAKLAAAAQQGAPPQGPRPGPTLTSVSAPR